MTLWSNDLFLPAYSSVRVQNFTYLLRKERFSAFNMHDFMVFLWYLILTMQRIGLIHSRVAGYVSFCQLEGVHGSDWRDAVRSLVKIRVKQCFKDIMLRKEKKY